ncbi:MAG: hypothetical protein AAFU65_14795 [Pseudomonadota bacterium]
MQTKTLFALLGTLIAAAGISLSRYFLGFGWILLTIIGGLHLVGYVVTAIAADARDRTTPVGEMMRGFLIGLNAVSNGVLLFEIVNLFAGTTGGIIVGGTAGIINLLASIGPLSRFGVYQGLLGYLNWLLPMSWPIVAFGMGFSLFSALLHGVTAGKVGYLRIEGMRMDWATGTVFMKGGLVANLNPEDTAFNMGNFSFVDRVSSNWHIEHEAGHTLNLAAFGFIFHLMGALDENATPRGENALAERIADSNHSSTGGSNIPMWA